MVGRLCVADLVPGSSREFIVPTLADITVSATPDARISVMEIP